MKIAITTTDATFMKETSQIPPSFSKLSQYCILTTFGRSFHIMSFLYVLNVFSKFLLCEQYKVTKLK